MELLIIGLVVVVIAVSIILVARKKVSEIDISKDDTPIGNTPIKDRVSCPFAIDPSFIPDAIVHAPKAEVDSDGKFYLSFGQANPAKGITVKGEEWSGSFSVYAIKDKVTERVVNSFKESTDYLWEASGKLSLISTERDPSIGFLIKD